MDQLTMFLGSIGLVALVILFLCDRSMKKDIEESRLANEATLKRLRATMDRLQCGHREPCPTCLECDDLVRNGDDDGAEA